MVCVGLRMHALSYFIFNLESGHLILNLISATQYVTFKKSPPLGHSFLFVNKE